MLFGERHGNLFWLNNLKKNLFAMSLWFSLWSSLTIYCASDFGWSFITSHPIHCLRTWYASDALSPFCHTWQIVPLSGNYSTGFSWSITSGLLCCPVVSFLHSRLMVLLVKGFFVPSCSKAPISRFEAVPNLIMQRCILFSFEPWTGVSLRDGFRNFGLKYPDIFQGQ